MQNSEKPILFFDGVCNLCNGYIDFLLRIGAGKYLCIASLQGETAKKLLPEDRLNSLNSVLFYVEGKVYEKSDAVLAIASRLAFPWKLFILFRVLPLFLRNFMYDFIAKHRYQWFGMRAQCRLPTPEERSIFLP